VSPAFVALCLVVIALGGILVGLWMSIDTEATIEQGAAPPAPPAAPEHYQGARRYGGPRPESRPLRPPSRERIQWLGGDETMGFWIWDGQPPDDQERARRNL
jgi:hypothetical protein